MTVSYFLNGLASNIALFETLLKPLHSPFIHWKQNPERWSVLEIVCHLVDEEREDFRSRVLFALEQRSGLPASIDPPGWVINRNYAQQDFIQKLEEFLQERRYSLQLLESFSDADWSCSFQHPKLGSLSALYLLENWLAHDLLHIKQILRLRYDYLIHLSGNTLDYAGAWT